MVICNFNFLVETGEKRLVKIIERKEEGRETERMQNGRGSGDDGERLTDIIGHDSEKQG